LHDRYAVGEVIGRGGMGDVRAGHDERLDRPVAIKFLRDDLSRRPELHERFEAEARAAARLSHPHVVAIYDTGETDDGIPYIVMECLPGRTLADEIDEGALDQTRVRTIALQVLSALDEAHRAGIVHRDVKPGNILLTESGDTKVADFGIAKSIDDDQTTGVLFGTAAYVSPERLTGERATPSSDLYSLGVVLYEALSGRKPFAGDSPVDMVRAVQRGKFAPLEGVDPQLRAVIEHAMAADPAKRYPSAADMARELEAGSVDAESTVPIERPRTPTRTMALPGAPEAPARRRGRAAPRERRGVQPQSRRALGLLALAAIFVGAVLVAAGVFSSDDAIPSTPPASTPVATTPDAVQLPSALDKSLRDLEAAIRR
jgi:serine/threonine protein kinase